MPTKNEMIVAASRAQTVLLHAKSYKQEELNRCAVELEEVIRYLHAIKDPETSYFGMSIIPDPERANWPYVHTFKLVNVSIEIPLGVCQRIYSECNGNPAQKYVENIKECRRVWGLPLKEAKLLVDLIKSNDIYA